MKTQATIRCFLLTALLTGSAAPAWADGVWGRTLPWQEAGLTERQAAVHLLDRLAYGPRPGDVDAMVELGLGNWIEGQLAGDFPGPVLDAQLARLPAMAMTQRQIMHRYSYGYVVQTALRDGVITMADYSGENGRTGTRRAMAALRSYAADRDLRPETELVRQFQKQKLLRAVASESQMVEVLTDFWFNHFNVSLTSDESRIHMLSYERDAIRPHVLTTFRQLLGATARHPAMLHYLGNARSVASEWVTTTFDLEAQELDRLSPADNPTLRRRVAKELGWGYQRRGRGPSPGLNENYARELLELHTLGVNGGYTQRDVIEVARAFTGWTTFPRSGARDRLEELLVESETAETARDMGFVVEDEFIFRADQHDSEAKSVLGVPLPAGRGIEDGEEVLDLVADHPSTRWHLSRKLAIRFVSEDPPQRLVRRLAETWELTGGDLREIILTLVTSPEFWRNTAWSNTAWSEEARRGKLKTPFELAVSALRALDANVLDPTHVLRWIKRMGQPVYGYSAPTGFPDREDHWLNVGPLLGRVNFGLELASGMPGIRIELHRPLRKRRLESLQEAVEIYFPLLMPERDPAATLATIAVDEDEAEPADTSPGSVTPDGEAPPTPAKLRPALAAKQTRKWAAMAVGMLIGSPEFQVH